MRKSNAVPLLMRICCLCVAGCLVQLAAFGQPLGEATVERSLFDLIGSEEMTNLTLTADFDSIKANIRNKEYVQGEFVVEHSRKEKTTLKVKLRPRGKSRRMMCEFPPIKLKFDKESLNANGLQPFNDFKLVTHCKSGDPALEAVLLREYLIYKLYNVITPLSFNAKLVEVTYKNKGETFNKTKNLGILLEDVECMAHRNGFNVLANKIIQLDSLHRNQEKITSVFEYMIGNADWSYMMGRNMELIQQNDGLIMPVPYDFDYSGLVRAPYARANAALGQKTVLDRVFLGNVKTYQELYPIFSYFKTKKAELIKVIDEFDAISNADADTMKDYMLGFFELIESQERVEAEMLRLAK